MLKIIAITAGVSNPSTTNLLGEQLADATREALENAGEQVEITQVALRDVAKPLTDFFSLGFPTGELAGVLDQLREADAVITVTPTFKASYAGLFKMFWDIVEDDDVRGKPVLLAATGGTSRHSLMVEHAMRPLFAYLRMNVMPTAVFAATDDYGADADLQPRINRAGAELATYLLGTSARRPVATEAPAEARNNVTNRSENNIEETLNAGSFFGIAGERSTEPAPDKEHKAPGLPALSVTPFEQLLKN